MNLCNIKTTSDLKFAIRNPYAWPGGYPVYIIVGHNGVLCHKCAKENFKLLLYSLKHKMNDEWTPTDVFVLYEGIEYCDNCDEQLESAYGECDEDV